MTGVMCNENIIGGHMYADGSLLIPMCKNSKLQATTTTTTISNSNNGGKLLGFLLLNTSSC
jgi:hypothetical protein